MPEIQRTHNKQTTPTMRMCILSNAAFFVGPFGIQQRAVTGVRCDVADLGEAKAAIQIVAIAAAAFCCCRSKQKKG